MSEEKTRKTIESYNRTAFTFAETAYSIDMSRKQNKFLELLPNKNSLILDLGCGPGRDSAYFLKQGFAVVGSDLSAAMLSEARQRVPGGHFVQADMRTLPFADGSFGAIWACASLLHIPKNETAGVLAEMYRVLQPQGRLYIAVKRGATESWRINEEKDLRFFFSYFLPSELWNKVVEAGFTVTNLDENLSETGQTEPDGSPTRWINLYAQKGNAAC